MKKLIYSLFAILCIAACEDPLPENNGDDPKDENPAVEITLDASSVDFTSEGGTQTVTFTSTADWTAKMLNDRADDWCSITPASGKAGSGSIDVTLKPNETVDDRSAFFVIKAGSVQKSVRVLQMPKDAIALIESTYEVYLEDGPYELFIPVLTNADISVEVSDNAKQWLQYKETRALKEKTLFFLVLPCEDPGNSTGVITLTVGDDVQTITVTQHSLLTEREAERQALIAFYNATGGDNWLYNNNWCSDRPLREWWGVKTDYNGFVTSIDFCKSEGSPSCNDLCGTLPPEFADLKHLTRFCVKQCRNFLCDGFPDALLKIETLTDLIIDQCGLSGHIPENIGDLKNLVQLSLQQNYLTGSVPASISNMKNLESLWLSRNGLTGDIPQNIGDLKNLVFLCMEENCLTGSIPASISNMQNLTTLWLSGNGLTGDIPQAIQEMPMWDIMWKSIIQQDPEKGGYINPETLNIYFPEFSFTTIDGSPVTDDYFKQKEYTIYYHYGLNCPFSDIFTPKLVWLYDQYKDKDIQLLSFVNSYIFPTVDEMLQYIDMHGITWPNVYVHRDIAHTLDFYQHLTDMPTLYVINKDRKIIYNDTSYDRNDFPKYLSGLLGDSYEEEIYESSDYSADGQVELLQKATVGNGIDVVLMGDAYTDRLIADGTYSEHMNKAYDAFFSIEPYKSFRDMFNVYSVNVVSKNEVYGVEGVETALNTRLGVFEGAGLTDVWGDDAKVFEYASKAVSPERMNEVVVITLMNAKTYAGTCYFYQSYGDGDWGNGPSISYFPLGASAETFEQLMHHETLGHGFAKLADEYYNASERVDVMFVDDIKFAQTAGYFKNVDFTDDPSQVRWSRFLADERYAGEDLGIFEGAYNVYAYGIYRPSKTSIMVDNIGGFNAPSREAIYYRLHKLASGPDWEYDYEKFVEYDAINRKSASTSGYSAPARKQRQNYVEQAFEPTPPPVFVNRTWREAR